MRLRFSTSDVVMTWIVVTVLVSLVAMWEGNWVWATLALAPGKVWEGEVWRLVTWIFVEPSPISLVFTVISIYKFGGDLSVRWGDRRLVRYAIDLLIGSAAVTCVLGLMFDSVFVMYRDAGWAVDDILVIAWARQFPTQELVIYRVLVLRGQQIVFLTLAITGLFAFAVGVLPMAPELLACLGAVLYAEARLRL